MIPVAAEAPLTIKMLIPWLALGHGIFNTVVMLCFCYQGWMGHVVRRRRLAGAPPHLPVVRRHRWLGPRLVLLGWTGFVAGLTIVLLDKGRVAAFPLHFGFGLAIALTLAGVWLASRNITGRGPTGRTLHRLLGILLLCLYPVQITIGLGVLL